MLPLFLSTGLSRATKTTATPLQTVGLFHVLPRTACIYSRLHLPRVETTVQQGRKNNAVSAALYLKKSSHLALPKPPLRNRESLR